MWQAGKDIEGGYKTVVSERAGQEDQEELNENQTNTKGNKGGADGKCSINMKKRLCHALHGK